MSVYRPKLTRQLTSLDGKVSFSAYTKGAMMFKPVGGTATFTTLTHDTGDVISSHPDASKTFVEDEEYWGVFTSIEVNDGTILVYTYGVE